MYNRYIPGSNGVYERHTVPERMQDQNNMTIPVTTVPASKPPVQSIQRANPDTGDLLLLCILLLILIDSEPEDLTGILITAAAFFFL